MFIGLLQNREDFDQMGLAGLLPVSHTRVWFKPQLSVMIPPFLDQVLYLKFLLGTKRGNQTFFLSLLFLKNNHLK